MAQEDKELLLIDLCARVPYHVRCKIWLKDGTTEEGLLDLKHNYGDVLQDAFYFNKIEDIKPYLRPMSSMTEEEKEELKQEHFKDERLFAECLTKMKNGDSSMRGKVIPHFVSDWCNKNHFDYRGLIEKGLALEASKEMYN